MPTAQREQTIIAFKVPRHLVAMRPQGPSKSMEGGWQIVLPKTKSYLIYYTIFDFLRWLFQSWRWLFQNFEMIIWMIIPDAVFEDIKTMIIWQIGMIIWDDYIRNTTILASCSQPPRNLLKFSKKILSKKCDVRYRNIKILKVQKLS